MPRLLIAVGSCSEALEVAPLLQAMPTSGIEAGLAWFGSEAALADARGLGLPAPQHVRSPAPGSSPSAHYVQATQFAAELLGLCTWSGLLSLGHGTWALAASAVASREGLPIVRLGAGQRSHRPLDRVDQARRQADHAATAWLVASEWQLHELRNEGLPRQRMRQVGSLLAAALPTLPTGGQPGAPFLWLALEHGETTAEPARLARLLANTAAAAQAAGLAVRAVPTQLGPAIERFGLVRPPGLALAVGADAGTQLAATRLATAVVTDSAGYQELAAAAAVPCLVLAGSSIRPDLLVTGACRSVAPDGGDLGAVLAQALAAPPAHPAASHAVATILAELPGLLAEGVTPRPAVAVAHTNLPSETDASGRTLGEDEVTLVAAAIRSGTLNSTRGTFVSTFEKNFATWLGTKHAIACASGSAAMHCAIAALQLQAGDEVITTPITDMGALTPMFYEGVVPVFADVDPRTLNVTAATIRAQLTARTRAIVVTHLFGLPAELEAILSLARAHDLPVIEDAAQAFGATHAGRRVGTFGTLTAFSLQQGKHITTGEGGLVATDDEALARRVFLFVNKAWGYGDAKPDHYFPALNYRLTELQGAVATAQLPKLDWVVARRREVAASLSAQLGDLRGLYLPRDPHSGTHSYWKYAFFVDPQLLVGGALALGKRMQSAGVACAPRYIQKPAFECELFREWQRSPVTSLPLQHNPRGAVTQPLFVRADYPGAVQALDEVLVLPINERYRPEHIDAVVAVIRAATLELQHG